MRSGYDIRPATADDAWLLCNIVGAVHATLGLAFDEAGEDADLVRIDEAYRAPGGEFWVLECNGAVSGCVGIRPDGRGGAELRRLYLAPAWRGLGLGRSLCETALAFAGEHNLSPVWAVAPGPCVENAALFAALGLRQTEPPEGVTLPESGMYLQRVN